MFVFCGLQEDFVRVITGKARGKRLATVEGLDVRPTVDRVKEAVFSMIHFEIENAVVLDLFAGSGQLGIEALSRGARYAVFVDNGRSSQAVILENLRHTGLTKDARVVSMDARAYLKTETRTFDFAFLDPPYASGLIGEVLPELVKRMNPTGAIICETLKTIDLPESAGDFSIYREYRYGRTKVIVYRAKDVTEI